MKIYKNIYLIWDKMMDPIIEYITSPSSIVSFIIFVFWLWATWSNLNWRVKQLEKTVAEFDIIGIKTTLKEIQKDIEWIRSEMKK